MDTKNLNNMAAGATLHCLTGCAIGEITGMVVGSIANLSNPATIALSVALAFLFGFSLSIMPLLKGGMAFKAALPVVLASDSLSIATMEIADNAVMASIPNAMNATLVNPLFWMGMTVSLAIAFAAAFPVNRYLLSRGKGHALIHQHHEHHAGAQS